MTPKEKSYFLKLKEAIEMEFSKNCGAYGPIENWKGETITLFQEDLFMKTKGKVSEKWFYTYIKKPIEKLPRIDILNLLSQYVGYNNWNDFLNTSHLVTKNKSKRRKWRFGAMLLIPIVIICYALYPGTNQFDFQFIDEETNLPITKERLAIKVLQESESPLHFNSDSLGKFKYLTDKESITFIVSSPFYKPDTITRHISSNENKVIKLKIDDYALILHYYTNGNIKDWQQRKTDLEELIAADAKIYQVFNTNIGIEIYTKENFINKLMIPTSSLKNIVILKKEFKNGQISTLKFMVK